MIFRYFMGRHCPPIDIKKHDNSYPLLVLLVSVLAGVELSVKSQDWDCPSRELAGKMTLLDKIQGLHGMKDAKNRCVPPIPRLHIPALRVADGPAGVDPSGASSQAPATDLPAPISLAAAWDAHLARRYGTIIGEECKALNEDLPEGPEVNIARVPQGDRTFEAFGDLKEHQ